MFAGPKVLLDDSVPEDTLKPFLTDIDYPVFYMNYNLNPQAVPWKDAISQATVKLFRGNRVSPSAGPRDLWFAVAEMVSRIVKSRHESDGASLRSGRG